MTVSFDKVLVVDDDEDIRFLVRMGLGRLAGKKVEEATSIDTALIAAAETRPDLILLDNDLHGESGLALLQQLPKGHPPVILVTARNDAETTQKYLDAGATAVLHKPFDPVNLLTDIVRLLCDDTLP